jgi:hypothetical protein
VAHPPRVLGHSRNLLLRRMISKLQISDWITLVLGAASFIAALAALAVAIFAIYRGNRNTSAATMVTLNVAFRDAWERFLEATPHGREFHFAELMNLFEIACAVYQDNSLAGVSGDLMKNYLEGILSVLIKTPYADEQIPKLLQGPTTFLHIKKFLDDKPKHPSVTVPNKWYESYARLT